MVAKKKNEKTKTSRPNASIWKLANERLMADVAVKNLIKAEVELSVLLEVKRDNGITKELVEKMKVHSNYKSYAEEVRNKARKGFGLEKEETNIVTCDLLNDINVSTDNKEEIE